jgi:hypothetical protein
MKMVVGYNMFSFDLFGLGRKAPDSKSVENEQALKRQNTEEQDTVADKEDDPERDMFFWALYPVF